MSTVKPATALILGLTALLSACPPSAPDDTATASATPTASASVAMRAPSTMPEGPAGEAILYGKQLMNETPHWLGPHANAKALRLAGNNLACKNCHLEAGTQMPAMGLIGTARRFPGHYAPLDREITLAERISACFERSLNGKTLPAAGKELKALEAYITWLSQDLPPDYKPDPGLPELAMPARAADPAAGAKLYAYHCNACHGAKGEGMRADDTDLRMGYTFPPLWGQDSFGEGSNMARLSVATRYIRANMPLGRPVLSVDEAYDLAGYMLKQPRPKFAGAGKDYPNPATRPSDVPYSPAPSASPAAASASPAKSASPASPAASPSPAHESPAGK